MKKIKIVNHKILDENSRRTLVSHCFKVCLVTNGEAEWQISGRVYRVKKDDIVLLGAGDSRIFKKIFSGRLLLTEINFEPELMFGTPFLPLFVNRPEGFPRVVESSPEARESFDRIARENMEKNLDFETALASLLSLLLLNIKRKYVSLGYSFHSERLSSDMFKALRYIDDNFDKEISLKLAAETIHMSESAFSKLFSKSTGIGFAKYINQKRIEKAVYLLQNTDETVLSIALGCGFNNTVSFYKAFSAQTNLKPAQYRKQGAVLLGNI